MGRLLRRQTGLATFEVLVAAALIALACTLLGNSVSRGPQRRQEALLHQRIEMLRQAVQQYQLDHGFYPGSSADWGYPLSDEQFRQKLARYTDLNGVPSETASHRFRFGPYLADLPAEPFGGSAQLNWGLQERRSAEDLAQSVAQSPAQGGWFYAPETGTILPNLGRAFPSQLASF